MWLQIADYADLIVPAKDQDLKDELEEYYKERHELLGETVYKYAHMRFMMKIEDIDYNVKLPLKPSNIRILEFKKDTDTIVALHELSLDRGKARLLSTKLGEKALKTFNNIIKEVKANGHNENDGGEIRQLSVAGLNIEATWYQYADKKKNEFYIVRPGSAKIEMMKEHQFLSFINVERDRFFEMWRRKMVDGNNKDDEKKNGKDEKPKDQGNDKID